MSLRRKGLILAAFATAATAAVVPAAGADQEPTTAKRATPVVSVEDDFFAPISVKIKQGQKVKWVWSDLNLDTHNVALTGQKPKKVKKSDFKSGSAAISYTYSPKFKVPGKYGFVCTFHRSVMTMTVDVKKKQN